MSAIHWAKKRLADLPGSMKEPEPGVTAMPERVEVESVQAIDKIEQVQANAWLFIVS